MTCRRFRSGFGTSSSTSLWLLEVSNVDLFPIYVKVSVLGSLINGGDRH